MRAGAAGLVIQHNDGWAFVECVGSVGPQVGVFSLAAARIKLAHRRFVGMQARSFAQQLGEPVGQRLKGNADAPDALCQGRAGQRHILARRDLLDPVQRQVVEVFARSYPGQQAHGSHAAVDHRWRDRRGSNGLAGAAGLLWTDMAMHEEARRFHIQLLADLFADLDQSAPH